MLADLPIIFVVLGLAAYTVLGGADFGAGFWTLFSGGGHTGPAATRAYVRHSMGPVWEANHVWLIFVLVICWTAYPVAFASIVSTLSVPLFIAAVGIILRGTAYALRGQLEATRGQRGVERVFALSSVLTPFALGTVASAIASGRVPIGNAKGNLVTSWLNPTSVPLGILGVAISSYLAAVYLAADAHRQREYGLERDFRLRALCSAVAAGALAAAALLVIRLDAPSFWGGLTSGGGLVTVVVSAAAGVTTLILVWRRHFGLARSSAALAVTAIMAGWALAQRPYLLSGLTVSQAAAGRSTLIALAIAVAAGAVVLVPSLMLLFGLLLRGRLDEGEHAGLAAVRERAGVGGRRPRLVGGFALACLLMGAGLTVFASTGWALAIGIICLFTCAISTFVLATTSPHRAR